MPAWHKLGSCTSWIEVWYCIRVIYSRSITHTECRVVLVQVDRWYSMEILFQIRLIQIWLVPRSPTLVSWIRLQHSERHWYLACHVSSIVHLKIKIYNHTNTKLARHTWQRYALFTIRHLPILLVTDFTSRIILESPFCLKLLHCIQPTWLYFDTLYFRRCTCSLLISLSDCISLLIYFLSPQAR